ncbi:hypothetical protein PRIPAC_90507 [Pristionchus pacificus]|uniref:G_PROTEIN_RECEP_F1_2 domain-containing protein n=1 Tax=Pristionchus pacificus TaxID=54126 RepID=A0A2A6CX57_PRIPA|nr:hypothetical protein PRIPAC_90507 [Pristionchus pacificus]|eukprot:PDM82666.1 hypothetical protein PRIPAC_37059 [Pristionchus pacificus]
MNRTCPYISYDYHSTDDGIHTVIHLISEIYREFYMYFVLVFAPINILANLLSMSILTRKELAGSYSNLFFGMTLDQTVVVVFLLSTVIRSSFTSKCDPGQNTIGHAIFTIVARNGMDILRAHASWLAVLVASLRFLMIRRRGFVLPSLCAILIWCFISLLVLISASTPVFMSTSIQLSPISRSCNMSRDIRVAKVRESEWAYYNDCLLLRVTYFISGTLHNGIPCCLLFVLSVLLLRHLRILRKECNSTNSFEKMSSDGRVTKMMTVILITTIISEMPQSILNILVVFLPSGFKANFVERVGNILTTIMLITSACNLFIYLSMSRKFKEVAKLYFFRVVPIAKRTRNSKNLNAKSSVRS